MQLYDDYTTHSFLSFQEKNRRFDILARFRGCECPYRTGASSVIRPSLPERKSRSSTPDAFS